MKLVVQVKISGMEPVVGIPKMARSLARKMDVVLDKTREDSAPGSSGDVVVNPRGVEFEVEATAEQEKAGVAVVSYTTTAVASFHEDSDENEDYDHDMETVSVPADMAKASIKKYGAFLGASVKSVIEASGLSTDSIEVLVSDEDEAEG